MIPLGQINEQPVAQAFEIENLPNHQRLLQNMEKIAQQQVVLNTATGALGQLSNENNNYQQQIQLMDNQINGFVADTSLALTKLLLKVGAKEIAFQIMRKNVDLSVAKLAAKNINQKIPLASAVMGVGASFYRFYQGQKIMALGELASGALANCGSYGVAASIALDLLMQAYDAKNFLNLVKQKADQSNNLTLEYAYERLKITVENPSQEEVNTCFDLIKAQIHPDINDEYQGAGYVKTIQHITMCKDFIYEKRGWQ